MRVERTNVGQTGDTNDRPRDRHPNRVPPSAPVLASGRAIGRHMVTGVGRFVANIEDLEAFRPGEIMLAELTLPEWRPVLETVAAIVTNRGGGGSHAAITARRLGVPAVVGTVDGASRLWTGATLTIDCDRGAIGRVYEGEPAPRAVTDETC